MTHTLEKIESELCVNQKVIDQNQIQIWLYNVQARLGTLWSLNNRDIRLSIYHDLFDCFRVETDKESWLKKEKEKWQRKADADYKERIQKEKKEWEEKTELEILDRIRAEKVKVNGEKRSRSFGPFLWLDEIILKMYYENRNRLFWKAELNLKQCFCIILNEA